MTMKFADIAVGDKVKCLTPPYEFVDLVVVAVAETRFRCELGWDEARYCKLYRTFDKEHGCSVGRKPWSWVVRIHEGPLA